MEMIAMVASRKLFYFQFTEDADMEEEKVLVSKKLLLDLMQVAYDIRESTKHVGTLGCGPAFDQAMAFREVCPVVHLAEKEMGDLFALLRK